MVLYLLKLSIGGGNPEVPNREHLGFLPKVTTDRINECQNAYNVNVLIDADNVVERGADSSDVCRSERSVRSLTS